MALLFPRKIDPRPPPDPSAPPPFCEHCGAEGGMDTKTRPIYSKKSPPPPSPIRPRRRMVTTPTPDGDGDGNKLNNQSEGNKLNQSEGNKLTSVSFGPGTAPAIPSSNEETAAGLSPPGLPGSRSLPPRTDTPDSLAPPSSEPEGALIPSSFKSGCAHNLALPCNLSAWISTDVVGMLLGPRHAWWVEHARCLVLVHWRSPLTALTAGVRRSATVKAPGVPVPEGYVLRALVPVFISIKGGRTVTDVNGEHLVGNIEWLSEHELVSFEEGVADVEVERQTLGWSAALARRSTTNLWTNVTKKHVKYALRLSCWYCDRRTYGSPDGENKHPLQPSNMCVSSLVC
eukprot:1194932-Prorocentrum_minimum.AAC.2